MRAYSSTFGDNCPRAYKYLEVKWECVESKRQPDYFACMNEYLTMTCNGDTYMDIDYADFGRKVRRPNNTIIMDIM